jgi:hypothetical protein
VRWGFRTALSVAAASILALPGVARATITVANTNPEGPGSLPQAIEDASPGETVVVPAGVYTLPATEAISKSLTISGHDAGDTIIRPGIPAGVFEIYGPATEVTIAGVTIRDGSGVPGGAGVLIREEAVATLRQVVVTGNVASADGEPGKFGGIAVGGGIYNQSGTLRMIGSSVIGNRASAVGGSGAFGGITSGGGIASYGPVTIEGSTIAANTVDSRGGQGPSDPQQFGGIAYGAGVALQFGATTAATIASSTISNNVSDTSAGPGGFAGINQGGGLTMIANDSSLSVSDSTIAGNEARALGGKGRLFGGGIYLEDAGKGTIVLTSSTLARNAVAPSDGEGGNLFQIGGTVTPSFRNTIVSGGVGNAGTENCSVKATSLGFNLEDRDECGFGAAGDQVNVDPQLGPLQMNGGPTATIAPAPSSPAVDRGAASGLGADQRGVGRPIEFPTIPNSPATGGDGSDIGAFELQPASGLSLGRLQRNRKRGTATLTVTVPVPGNGTVTLSGKGLKPQSAPVAGVATIQMPVIGMKPVAKALRRRGKRNVGINVTYAPEGNAAVTLSRKAKLFRRLNRKKRRRHHPAAG